MSTVTVNLGFEEQQYPAGTTSKGVMVTLNVPAGAPAISGQVIASGQTSVVFENVPDGTGYTATAQLQDENGNPIGSAATSTPFDVVTPTVGISTPNLVTVTVS